MTMETSMVPRSEGLRPSMIRHGTSYCAEDTWPCDVQHPQCSVFFFFVIKACMFWAGKTTHRIKFEDSTRRFLFAANSSCQVVAPF